METKFYIKSQEKRGGKISSDFLGIYGQDKTLADNKGKRFRQDAVINASMRFGFPISQYILYKQYHTKTKVDTRFINITYSPCVDIALKFEGVIFYILEQATV